MITLPNSKIEAACVSDKSDKEERPILANPYFEPVDETLGRLVAGDGFIIAVVPVVHQNDDEGPIPVEAIKEARRKQKATKSAEAFLVADGGVVHCPFQEEPHLYERPEGKFPHVDKIKPDFHRGPVVSITLDVSLLARLAKALTEDAPKGTSPVTLTFNPENDAIVLVEPMYAGAHLGRYGLLAPIARRRGR